MRWLAAVALALALAPAAAEARPRAAVVFMGDGGSTRAMLGRLARRPNMAIGLTSPTVGGTGPQQMALDMTQGARIPVRLYSGRSAALRLERVRGGWRLAGWLDARRRARDAPGNLVPGLLASTVEGGGGRVAYVGTTAAGALGPIVAANEAGRVDRVSLGAAPTLGARLVAQWNAADLLVADLPADGSGLRALGVLLGARSRDDVVYVVQIPAGRKLRLLPSGLAGPRGAGRLRSATTRLTGVVAAIDVGPTVLDALGLHVPHEMDGEPIVPRGTADAAVVARLGERLSVVAPRRGFCLAWLGGVLAALLLALSLARGAAGARAGLRIAALAALWAPGLMLLTAALAPSRLAEALVIALGSAALAIATDRVLAWPVAPALPAAVVFLAHAVDLARGSPLIDRSLAGPNPFGGARFYGIGNELETILAVSVLIGTGAALAWMVRADARAADRSDARVAGDRRSARRAPGAFAVVAAVAAAVMGAGRLGADVGAVITLAVGGAAAVLAELGGRPSRRALALAIAAPVAALGALIVIDLVTHGGAHLTRSVLHAQGSGDLADIAKRRVRAAVRPLGHPGAAVVFAIALVIVVALAVGRRRVFAALEGAPGAVHLRAGLVGAFFAVVTGTLANDSGPLILEIGVVLLALAAAYAAARPPFGDAA